MMIKTGLVFNGIQEFRNPYIHVLFHHMVCKLHHEKDVPVVNRKNN